MKTPPISKDKLAALVAKIHAVKTQGLFVAATAKEEPKVLSEAQLPTQLPTQPSTVQQPKEFKLNFNTLSATIEKLDETNNSKSAAEIVQEINLAAISSGTDLYGQETTDKFGNAITYNAKQKKFISLASSGESCVLIGAAGTGKTTCQKGATQALIQSGIAGILDAGDHNHLISGTPGIVICAYTRRAVANIRRNVSDDMKSNCITIHKLLEYQPVYYSTENDKGEEVKKMKFEATRNQDNPLPASIHTIIVEEGSMVGTDLYEEIENALQHQVQWIFLGDIQQLPPVFGPAILGYKLLELPVVELTEVYRQALESPIISLAHRVLSGVPILKTQLDEWKRPGLTLHPWKKKLDDQNALSTACTFFNVAFDKGAYNPDEDIILVPFNKSFGTIEMNNSIANHLARARGATTYQIIGGIHKVFLSEGDKVLYDKEDATVIKVESNPSYTGMMPLNASKTLDYWGHDPESKSGSMTDEDQVDFLLAQIASQGSSEEGAVRSASHIVTLRMNDSDQEIKISTAGEINGLLLGYVLTVHKSQGSEWRKVFFVLHQSHATMVSRELLYTGLTRAKEELYVICEPESFDKGIRSQRIKGNTLEEKAEYFKGKTKRDNDERID